MPVAVGIDISKKDFEARMLKEVGKRGGSSFTGENGVSGFQGLLSWARKEAAGEEVLFCMESTGGYEFSLACHLAQAGERVSIENPRRIKHFAISLGMANKTDKADARAIAAYALATNPRSWLLADETRRHISLLCRHRDNLVAQLGIVKNHLEHAAVLPKFVIEQSQMLKDLLEDQIKAVEEERRRVAEQSEEFTKQMAVLLKLGGIAEKTAFLLLSEMPDTRCYDSAESWVAQAGLHPCRRQSGQWTGQTRMSKCGNSRVRRGLYMGATMSMKLNPAVKALAERLREKGKRPKQIRIACMRKLLLICYGILKALDEGRTPFFGLPPEKCRKGL